MPQLITELTATGCLGWRTSGGRQAQPEDVREPSGKFVPV